MKFGGEFFMRLLNQNEIHKRHCKDDVLKNNRKVTIYVHKAHNGHAFKLEIDQYFLPKYPLRVKYVMKFLKHVVNTSMVS